MATTASAPGKPGEAQGTPQESEARLRALVEITTDILWEVDQGGDYTYCSSNLARVTGHRPEVTHGKNPVDFMPPEDAARFGQLLGAAVAEAKSSLIFRHSIRLKGGGLLAMECLARPLFDEMGNIKGYRCTNRSLPQGEPAQKPARHPATLETLGQDELKALSRKISKYLLPWGW